MESRLEEHLNHLFDRYPQLVICREEIIKAYHILEEAMNIALKAGAKAGKVSGAGGGGFIMFIVEPTKKKNVEGGAE